MSSLIPFYACAGEFHELKAEILDVTEKVFATGQMLQGPQVEAFEHEIASICGRAHAIAVGSGTDALFFALTAAGILPGDEVLVQDISFLASASAILRAGARPIFVDIDDKFGLDLEKAAERLSPKTRAIVAVQLFGAACNPLEIDKFAERHGLKIIEDFAQSFGASYANKPCGSFGLTGATSFDPTKVIGAPGCGGAVVTDELSIAQQVRRLRLHGREERRFVELGYNSQMSSLTAAVLSLKLTKRFAWRNKRQVIANFYSDRFSGIPVMTPKYANDVDNIYHKFVLFTQRRDELLHHLLRNQIPAMVHYPVPLHREPIFGSAQADDLFPNANRHADQALSLPIHAGLDSSALERIASEVLQFFQQF